MKYQELIDRMERTVEERKKLHENLMSEFAEYHAEVKAVLDRFAKENNLPRSFSQVEQDYLKDDLNDN